MEPALHKLTVKQFQRMGEIGIFHEGDRIELIEGELFDMTPIGPAHAAIVNFLTAALVRAMGPAIANREIIVSTQNPIVLDEHNEPEPDFAILKPKSYRDALPRPDDILLLIEVSHTTLRYDRDIKIPLYARHDISEVWLIDVQGEALEIYLEPSSKGYQQIIRPATIGIVTPTLLPETSVDLAGLFA